MSTATIERSSPAVAELSTSIDPLSRSYDPPIRGPILLASVGRGATNASFYIAGALARRAGVGVEVAGVLEPYPTLLFGANPPMYPPARNGLPEISSVSNTRLRNALDDANSIAAPATLVPAASSDRHQK